jgi:hypothetical protein
VKHSRKAAGLKRRIYFFGGPFHTGELYGEISGTRFIGEEERKL